MMLAKYPKGSSTDRLRHGFNRCRGLTARHSQLRQHSLAAPEWIYREDYGLHDECTLLFVRLAVDDRAFHRRKAFLSCKSIFAISILTMILMLGCPSVFAKSDWP
jgi:hypothetical protein